MQGSDAGADAANAAGCRFFTGYPILPFTELLENMAKKLPAAGGVCINAESEIEAINMALGAAATGARAATGSCGQGVSLMQEGIAELALNELPMGVFTMARGQQDYFQSPAAGGAITGPSRSRPKISPRPSPTPSCSSTWLTSTAPRSSSTATTSSPTPP